MADAFDDYKQSVAKTLVKNQAGAFATGYISGSIKSGTKPKAADVRAASKDWATQYTNDLIKNGGSIHKGEFIPWLDDSSSKMRKEISDIISTGIKEGKPTGKKEWKDRNRYQSGSIANDLKEKFDSYKSQASTIARTETRSILNQAELSNFLDNDREYVEVSDGDSDGECSDANGQIWSIEYSQSNELEHPNCVREFSPMPPGWNGYADEE